MEGWVARAQVVAHCLNDLAQVEIFNKGRMGVVDWESLTDGESDVGVEGNFDGSCNQVGCVLQDDIDPIVDLL